MTPTRGNLRTFTVAALLCALVTPHVAADSQLTLFVQGGSDHAKQLVGTKYGDDLREMAQKLGVTYRVVDVAKQGAPAEVKITPLFAYQNWRGRSIYQGRYLTADRIRNFVRTSRVMPQGDDRLTMSNLPVMKLGDVAVGSPIKITDLGGDVPEGFDQAAFKRDFKARLAKGFKRFGFVEQYAFNRTDRLFYMDFYPYKGEDGKFFISVALFSQFHCHEPVFREPKEPLAAKWEDRDKLIARAAAVMEKQVEEQIKSTKLGDGFNKVPRPAKTVSWDALGLKLPAKPQRATSAADADITLGRGWKVAPPKRVDQPTVQFAFASPLDNYSGEVNQLTGTMKLGENLSLAQAKGKFEVAVKSLTMGESDLDDHIHGDLLKVAKHPTATFTFASVQTNVNKVTFGPVMPATLVGKFELMGQSIDLNAPATIEAFVDDQGKPRISIDAVWKLRIDKPWKLEGPPGPKDAQMTMNFRAHIQLTAVEAN